MSAQESYRNSSDIEARIEHNRETIVDILESLQHRLSPGQLFDQAYAYVRTEGGDVARSFGASVKSNPLPLALVGIGVGWMMFSGPRGTGDAGWHSGTAQRYHHRGEHDDVEHGEGRRRGLGEAPAGYRSDSSHPSAGERLEKAREGVSASIGAAGQRATEMAHDARDRMHETTGNVRDRAGRAVGIAQERVSHAGEAVERGTRRAGNMLTEMIEERPLAVGVLGLAIGAVLGAMLPSTRQEDRWMGATRDSLGDRAAEEAERQLEHFGQAAAATAEHAKTEAERQHFDETGRKLAADAREGVDKAADVASSTIERAAEELKSGATDAAHGDEPKSDRDRKEAQRSSAAPEQADPARGSPGEGRPDAPRPVGPRGTPGGVV